MLLRTLVGLSAVCGLSGPLTSPWARAVPPVAVNNTYPLGEDTPIIVPASQGVSANDTLNGNVVEVVPVAAPAHGALMLNTDGSFTYAPQPDYSGNDTFTYRLRTVPGPVTFTIDQARSRMQVDARATTSAAGNATSKDDSRVAGTIKAALTPAATPFSQARVTGVDAHLVDKVDLEFGFGCIPILGCLATVGVHTRTANPDWLTLSLDEPGPAAIVTNTLFSQLGNTFRLKGVVDVAGTGLASDLITPGAQTMDTTASIDLPNCQITAAGTTLTLKVPVTYTGRFFLDPADTTTDYVDLTVRTAFTGSSGFIIATAPASANVPVLSNLATVTLQIAPVDDDQDDDGIDDDWELAHGLNPQSSADAVVDSDGDGQVNRDEFLANTDPRNAASVLAVLDITLAGTSLEVTFSGLDPTREYQRQESADFVTWTEAGPVFTPTGSTQTLSVPAGSADRYHRLRVVTTWP